MNGSRWFILLIFAAFALTTVDIPFSWDSDGQSGGIDWQSYASGTVKAAAESKPVFLHFYAEWCRWCKKMAKETFREPSLVKHLNDDYVAIRIDYDVEKPIVDEFGVGGVPATYVIQPDGQVTGPLLGYFPGDRLLAALKKIQPARSD